MRALNRTSAVVFAMATLVSACGGDKGTDASSQSTPHAKALAVSAQPSATVVALTKVSETRVGRTVYDYVFKITVQNGSTALTGVAAHLVSVGQGTTIVEGDVVVGEMAAGASVTPADTITLRHDRTSAFMASALVWTVTGEPTVPSVPGILLPGDQRDLAFTKLEPFAAQRTAADLQIVDAPDGARYYRSQFYATIKQGATVGQINSALSAIGGRIVFIAKNSPVVTIQVPAPASVSSFEALIKSLIDGGAFESASLVSEIGTNAIPSDVGNISPAQAVTPGGPVFHHLAARFGGVWNLRGMKVDSEAVQYIVVDYFGDGPVEGLAGTADGILSGSLCSHPITRTPNSVKCEHGYHVLGIIAGSFGGANTDHGRVTGASPFALPVHAIDLAGGTEIEIAGETKKLLFHEFVAVKLAELVTKNPAGKYVMNMSLGMACRNPTGDCGTLERVTAEAKEWRSRMRSIWPTLPATAPFDYDKQLIQVTSAGNQGSTATALRNSPWNAAVLLGPLGNQAPLTNGLVVENRTTTIGPTGIPMIGALSSTSTIQGNIAAVGTNVFSFLGPESRLPKSTGVLSGTSMAAPQVAGLAGSMLAIRPSLSAQDIVSKVIQARFIEDNSPTPAIDAYAAVLSLDASLADAPARSALLMPSSAQVSAGGTFGTSEAREFLKAYFPAIYGGSSPQDSLNFPTLILMVMDIPAERARSHST